MKLKIFSVVTMVFALTACSDDNDSPNYELAPSIDVITVSGVTVILEGTLERPCAINASGVDYLVTETISRNVGIRTEYLYTSTDRTCSAGEVIETVSEVTFVAGAVMAITGWVDLDGISIVPPLAQDGSPLSDTESVTSLIMTIKSVDPADPNLLPGDELPAFYVVDDTVAGAPVMYGKSDFGNEAFNVPMTLQ